MDIIFDIDGTLAEASHRLHFIKDVNYWIAPQGNPLVPRKPDWDSFLSPENLKKDSAIFEAWEILYSFLLAHHRVIFLTGRKESTRQVTWDWLMDLECPSRAPAAWHFSNASVKTALYMRSENDRRKSWEVKQDLLNKARSDGFDPRVAFDDRADDISMYRKNRLLACQVSDGQF